MAFSCLSHGRAELDCKDCREEAASELMRLSRGTLIKGQKIVRTDSKTRQALRLGMEALNKYRQIQNA